MPGKKNLREKKAPVSLLQREQRENNKPKPPTIYTQENRQNDQNQVKTEGSHHNKKREDPLYKPSQKMEASLFEEKQDKKRKLDPEDQTNDQPQKKRAFDKMSLFSKNSCRAFFIHGSCPRGDLCPFTHQHSETIDTVDIDWMKRVPEVNWTDVQLEPFQRDLRPNLTNVNKKSTINAEELRKEDWVTIKTMDHKDISHEYPIVESFSSPYIPPEFQTFMEKEEFALPTVVQAHGWPIYLAGKNVVTLANTGSGKTLSYLLPALVHVLQRLQDIDNAPRLSPIALILVPTRELAQQIYAVSADFEKLFGVSCGPLFGGADKALQIRQLMDKRHVHILAATPARLLDCLARKQVVLTNTSFFVLDEADKLLQHGLIRQLLRINNQIRPDRQMLMFSATFPERLEKTLNPLWAQDPFVIFRAGILPPNNISDRATGLSRISPLVTQTVHLCAEHKKPRKLFKFLITNKVQEENHKVLVYVNRVDRLPYLTKTLRKNGFFVQSLYGAKQQSERESILKMFIEGKMTVLLCTDVLARGLNIPKLQFIVNYDFPPNLQQYVHRVGRLGRDSLEGTALSFFTRDLVKMAPDLVELLRIHEQKINHDLLMYAKTQEKPKNTSEQENQTKQEDEQTEQTENIETIHEEN